MFTIYNDCKDCQFYNSLSLGNNVGTPINTSTGGESTVSYVGSESSSNTGTINGTSTDTSTVATTVATTTGTTGTSTVATTVATTTGTTGTSTVATTVATTTGTTGTSTVATTVATTTGTSTVATTVANTDGTAGSTTNGTISETATAAESPPVKKRKIVIDSQKDEQGILCDGGAESEMIQHGGEMEAGSGDGESVMECTVEPVSNRVDNKVVMETPEEKKKKKTDDVELMEVNGVEEGMNTPGRGGDEGGDVTPDTENKTKPIHPFFSKCSMRVCAYVALPASRLATLI